MRRTKSIYKYCWYYLLIVNAILFALLSLLLPLRFEENDDVVMCMIANGNMSGLPDCHLVFINALWGTMLTFLYGMTKAVEWYIICFAIVHIMSATIIINILIKHGTNNKLLRVLWLILCYVLWIRMIITFQFTTTAAISCMAGCLVLLYRADYKELIGGGMILVASLIRFDAAVLVAILFAPYFVYRHKLKWKEYIPYIFIAVVVLSAKYADGLFYQERGWKEYREYNTVRGKINDNPNFFRAILPAEIDDEDFNQLISRAFADPEIMTTDVLRSIYDSMHNVVLHKKMKNIIWLWKNGFIKPIILILLLILFLLYGADKSDRWLQWTLVVLGLLFVGIICGLSLEHTLKSRVFLCILTTIICILAQIDISDARTKWIIPLLTSILCAYYVFQGITMNNKYNENRESAITQLQQASEYSEGEVVFSGLGVESLSPYQIKDFNIRLYPAGWLTKIPLYNYTSHRDLLREEVLILIKDVDSFSLHRKQLYKHYGIETEMVLCKQLDGEYALYKLQEIGRK